MMNVQKRKRIPYGVSSYAEMVRKNCYFIDKTEYIEKLEMVQNPARHACPLHLFAPEALRQVTFLLDVGPLL